MTVKQLQDETNQLFFCTFTCYKWYNLFDITQFYDHLYHWFIILQAKQIQIIGFVFMPNHVHCILYLPYNSEKIHTIIGNGKRFMAYEIVKRLELAGNQKMLTEMQAVVSHSDRNKNKKHQVFQPSFDSKDCFTQKFILQKLDYMHHNPVVGKWKLVEDYIDYYHSSAKFYELGEEHPLVKLTHFEDAGLY